MTDEEGITPIRVKDRVKGAPSTRNINDRNGNTRFRKVVTYINKKRRLIKPDSDKFTVTQASEIYNTFNGRCAYCGRPLNVGIGYGDSQLHMEFYIPLERGGMVDKMNIMPICPEHFKSRVRSQELREDIPDLNTFADHVALLIDSVVEFRERPTRPLNEKIKRIKRLLNFTLDEIAINMKYKPYEDWLPEQFEMITEEHNTIPDHIEKLIEDKVDVAPDEVIESDKKAITEVVKQVVITGQYGFVRNPKDMK